MNIAKRITRKWKFIILLLIRRGRRVVYVEYDLLACAFRNYYRHNRNVSEGIKKNNFIDTNPFEELIELVNDHFFLLHFRFLREDMFRVVPLLCRKPSPYLTKKNFCSFNPLHPSFLMVRRLENPYR